jgi:hypothetical protein
MSRAYVSTHRAETERWLLLFCESHREAISGVTSITSVRVSRPTIGADARRPEETIVMPFSLFMHHQSCSFVSLLQIFRV